MDNKKNGKKILRDGPVPMTEMSADDPFYKTGFVVGGQTLKRSSKKYSGPELEKREQEAGLLFSRKTKDHGTAGKRAGRLDQRRDAPGSQTPDESRTGLVHWGQQ